VSSGSRIGCVTPRRARARNSRDPKIVPRSLVHLIGFGFAAIAGKPHVARVGRFSKAHLLGPAISQEMVTSLSTVQDLASRRRR